MCNEMNSKMSQIKDYTDMYIKLNIFYKNA